MTQANVPNHRKAIVTSTAKSAVTAVTNEYAIAVIGSTDDSKWRNLRDLEDVVDSSVNLNNPETLDKALRYGTSAIALELNGDTKFQAFRRLANFAAQQPDQSGGAGDAQDAVYAHLRTLAGVQMAQAALEKKYARAGEVVEDMMRILTVLEDEASRARQICENVLFMAIRDYSIDMQQQLYAKAYSLPRYTEYDFSGGVSPLTAAYSIFGDAKRHRELEAGNIVGITGLLKSSVTAIV